MKITDLKTAVVRIPFEAPLRWHMGHEVGTTRTIVEVSTDEGIVGLGETMGGEATQMMIQGFKKDLVGESPFDIERIVSKFYKWVPYFSGYTGYVSIGAIDMACFDIMGKAKDQPVYQLIGGAYRKKVPFSAFIFYRDKGEGGVGGEESPEDIVQFCKEVIKKYGFKVLKLKAGVFSPWHEVETIRAMDEAFGEEYKFRIDPNGLWTPQEALHICRELEKYNLNLEYIEDPVWGIEGMARVRREIHVPFATNMCVVDFDQLPVAIRLGAIDVILADPHKWGGIWAVKKLAAVCEVFKLGLGMHSGAELGISTAANLHIGASTPNMEYALDSHYHHLIDDIIQERFTYENGCMAVPEKPGLGVELSEEKVEKYAELYAKEKEYKLIGGHRIGSGKR